MPVMPAEEATLIAETQQAQENELHAEQAVEAARQNLSNSQQKTKDARNALRKLLGAPLLPLLLAMLLGATSTLHAATNVVVQVGSPIGNAAPLPFATGVGDEYRDYNQAVGLQPRDARPLLLLCIPDGSLSCARIKADAACMTAMHSTGHVVVLHHARHAPLLRMLGVIAARPALIIWRVERGGWTRRVLVGEPAIRAWLATPRCTLPSSPPYLAKCN